jgi:hypothetical protein
MRILSFIMVMLVLMAPAVYAQAQPTKPLMVVRFFTDQVSYERPLYQAVSEALKANPGMMFDVVVFSPARNEKGGSQMQAGYGQRMLASMQRMGVPSHRLTLSHQATPHANVPEVHLFVR